MTHCIPILRRGLAALSLGLAALAAAPAVRADTALYEAFGGEAGLARIADDFLANVTSDPRTQPYFAKASRKRLRAKLAEHFCVEIGGPCTYTGSSMASVHKNLQIDRAAFNAVVENLQDAMDKNGVGFAAQNALLARLAPLYRQIETR
ncbi:group I truncated hemoglobin [Xylophilus ampelinus]|uniref:Hemoglobin n=1 Tax=Xylophilus ampelinus TaxID=54067 RepID=A0A318SI72_9BURK|nr:group 1 truncated hemoglobin [Xylophilus ampelinus]MCS4511293.1 group 1 truncated hemoglobin [Xylophilus ampelinus]PYE74945.1 hemoglobin [Xylophilus ampelinus]